MSDNYETIAVSPRAYAAAVVAEAANRAPIAQPVPKTVPERVDMMYDTVHQFDPNLEAIRRKLQSLFV